MQKTENGLETMSLRSYVVTARRMILNEQG